MLPLPPRFMPRLGPKKATARERVLAQWRGIDLAPAEKVWTPHTEQIADLLPSILSEFKIDRRRTEVEVTRVWNNLLDPTITAHAQPTGHRNGTLFVTVDSNVWLSEIVRYRRKEILDRLRHCFGRDLITKISFRVG